jgi:glutamate dehydrogenase
MHSLERSGELSRALEFLPNDEELAERRKKSARAHPPGACDLLSYSKIWLSKHLLASDVPADPYLSRSSSATSPPGAQRFARAISRHRLRREIIAMATTNSLVNRMGPTFVARAQDDTGASACAHCTRLHRGARDLRHARSVGADRGARQQGAGEAAVRHDV